METIPNRLQSVYMLLLILYRMAGPSTDWTSLYYVYQFQYFRFGSIISNSSLFHYSLSARIIQEYSQTRPDWTLD